MNYYIPHYSDQTYTKRGECASGADIRARQQMIREMKLECCGEVWDNKDGGIVPLYSCETLYPQDELDLICMRVYDKERLTKKN